MNSIIQYYLFKINTYHVKCGFDNCRFTMIKIPNFID